MLSSCARKKTQELLIVSPHVPEIRREFSEGFSEWYRGRTGRIVAVRWLDVGGTGQSVEYIKSRNSGKNPAGGVDLLFGGGDLPYVILAGQNLLQKCPVPQDVLSRIPKEIHGIRIVSPDSVWYGATLASFGIIINKDVAGMNGLALPRSWKDLAEPACRGWVASADPRYSGTVHVAMELILQTYGWDKGWEVLFKLAGNVQDFTNSASVAAKDVALGQAAFGLSIDYYASMEVERYGADHLAYVLPEGESIVNPDCIAVLKNAANPEAARAFVEYVLSDGQKLFALKKGEPGGPRYVPLCRMPVDSTLYKSGAGRLSVDQDPFASSTLSVYNGRLAGSRWSLMGDLFAACLLTPHGEIKAFAGKAGTRLSPEAIAAAFAPPITENEAPVLSGDWNKPGFALERIRKMNAWTEAVKKRFR
jgi:ABC-type Fe3+ transport system substrate-binding protein